MWSCGLDIRVRILVFMLIINDQRKEHQKVKQFLLRDTDMHSAY